MHVQERLAGRRKGEKCRCLCPICICEIQLLGTCVQTERSKTFASPITSRVTFSTQHSRGIRGPLWHPQTSRRTLTGHSDPESLVLTRISSAVSSNRARKRSVTMIMRFCIDWGHSSRGRSIIRHWAVGDVWFREIRKNKAKDSGRSFPSVCHYVGCMTVVPTRSRLFNVDNRVSGRRLRIHEVSKAK